MVAPRPCHQLWLAISAAIAVAREETGAKHSPYVHKLASLPLEGKHSGPQSLVVRIYVMELFDIMIYIYIPIMKLYIYT